MSIKKKYEIVKNNFNSVDNEKNEIFKQIHELNNSLTKTNIVGTQFVKDKVEVDNINSKVLNDISKANVDSEDIKSETDSLDEKINEIFK